MSRSSFRRQLLQYPKISHKLPQNTCFVYLISAMQNATGNRHGSSVLVWVFVQSFPLDWSNFPRFYFSGQTEHIVSLRCDWSNKIDSPAPLVYQNDDGENVVPGQNIVKQQRYRCSDSSYQHIHIFKPFQHPNSPVPTRLWHQLRAVGVTKGRSLYKINRFNRLLKTQTDQCSPIWVKEINYFFTWFKLM